MGFKANDVVAPLPSGNCPWRRHRSSFAIQQTIEGSQWLLLEQNGTGALTSSLTLLYLFVAQVWWPVVAPMTALVMEPKGMRRRLMSAGLLMGLAVAAYLLWAIVMQEHRAAIIEGHLVYVTESPAPLSIGLPYLAATTFPLLLSSHHAIAALGALAVVGAIVTYFLYWEAFVSVCCFFAAASSVLILFHFQSQRRRLAV